MNIQSKQGFFANLKYDFPASIIVFLVALPLCLGIALVSGAPLFSGVIAGVVGGVVVGLLSGSNLGVSGPAAGLAVIVFSAINELGSFEVFLFAVVVAGLIQLILGFARAGIIGYYFPGSVIKGMLAAIGILIILNQIPYALGVIKKAAPEANYLEKLSYMLSVININALTIAVVSLAILILWDRPFMKRLSFTNIIQGPLVVVLLGILSNLFFQTIPGFALDPKHLVDVPVADSIVSFFGQFTLPDFSQWNNPRVHIIAGTLAVVASLETLLIVEATDKLDPFKRVTPTDRELKAQGVGNIISGLIGGIPVTQVIVRSSANIQSGGRTKASVVIHGLLLLVCVMSIPRILNLIPLASLAAILIMVGFKLAKPSLIKKMYANGWSEFIPFMVTIVGIVATDLLIGIGMGMAVAIFYILRNNYKIPYHFNLEDYTVGKPIKIQLSEDVSFLNKASIQKTLDSLPDGSSVMIDASRAVYVHPDIIEIIEDFKQRAKLKNIRVLEKGELETTEGYNPIVEFSKVFANPDIEEDIPVKKNGMFSKQ
jgi:MFS superfamily sulfate permease-like transporter